MNKPKLTLQAQAEGSALKHADSEHSDEKLRLLFLGDCNTSGTDEQRGHAYPELLARTCNGEALNCGHTMSTTREAIEYIRHVSIDGKHKVATKDKSDTALGGNYDLLFVQYGLVDSWITLRAAPYVLYFPDSPLRRFLRSWVKKWKKYGKRLGLGKLFGLQNVVPIEEYERNILTLIEHANGRPVYLIETVPNKDLSRNAEIQRYNAILKNIAADYSNVHLVETYGEFEHTYSHCYVDQTHISADGHKVLQAKLLEHLNANNLLPTREQN
jgi:lysophospholipase L1-like esterase